MFNLWDWKLFDVRLILEGNLFYVQPMKNQSIWCLVNRKAWLFGVQSIRRRSIWWLTGKAVYLIFNQWECDLFDFQPMRRWQSIWCSINERAIYILNVPLICERASYFQSSTNEEASYSMLNYVIVCVSSFVAFYHKI